MSKRARVKMRREMRRVLTSLDSRWLKAASAEICTNVRALLVRFEEGEERREIKRILAWTRFFPGEVDLAPLISTQIGKREIYLPRSLPDKSMTFLSVGAHWPEQMEAGEAGIPEPAMGSGKSYELTGAEDTLVLVPGLIFDRRGNRIGRGKGYYDRFLGQIEMRSALKIGVFWNLQLVGEVKAESHDVPVDWICHERGFEYTGQIFDDDF